MNVGAAAGAGIAAHLHLHLVPRWNGDTNFMPVLGDVKVLPETLAQTYEKVVGAQALRVEKLTVEINKRKHKIRMNDMARTPLIAGNWKMNKGTAAEATALTHDLLAAIPAGSAERRRNRGLRPLYGFAYRSRGARRGAAYRAGGAGFVLEIVRGVHGADFRAVSDRCGRFICDYRTLGDAGAIWRPRTGFQRRDSAPLRGQRCGGEPQNPRRAGSVPYPDNLRRGDIDGAGRRERGRGGAPSGGGIA